QLDFSASFLDFAFAKHNLTGTDRFADDLCGMGLGHGDQLDVGHVSSGHLRRLSNLVSHAVEICFDIDHSFQSEHFSPANPVRRSRFLGDQGRKPYASALGEGNTGITDDESTKLRPKRNKTCLNFTIAAVLHDAPQRKFFWPYRYVSGSAATARTAGSFFATGRPCCSATSALSLRSTSSRYRSFCLRRPNLFNASGR